VKKVGINKGLLFCLLVILLVGLPLTAEAGFLITNPQSFTLSGETTFTFPENTTTSRVEVPLLLNRLDQGFGPYLAVHALAITPKPSTIISDTEGNLRAVYSNYHNLGILNVRQKALVETRQVKFIPNKPYTADGSFAQYLKPSEAIESDNPIIRRKAAEVTRGITDPYDKVRAVFGFVQTHMTFNESEQYAHKGALSALITGKGTCDDHAALMVALLRASGIPARNMGGYAVNYSIQSEDKGVNLVDSARHEWVEFYLKGEGWIPADPNTRQNKGDDYPKWSHLGGLNSNWEYIPDSVGKSVGPSYTYTVDKPGIEARISIRESDPTKESVTFKERVTIKEGLQPLDDGWYLVMSDTEESLYPAPYYLPYQTATVKLNGKIQAFSPPAIVNLGTTFIPFRPFFEALGGSVRYYGQDKQVEGHTADTKVIIRIGSRVSTVNGRTVSLGQAPQVISGTVYVPASFVVEALGGDVVWNKDKRLIVIDRS